MLNEQLYIKNFAGISEANLELDRMNVLIGPQASGKSVCAKLAFFFKESIRRMILGVSEERTKPQIRADDKALFLNYFPPTSWAKGSFVIVYSYGDFKVTVERKARDSATVEIAYSKYYDRLLYVARQTLRRAQDSNEHGTIVRPSHPEILYDQLARRLSAEIGPMLGNRNYFIPAGRSFFSTIRSNVFSFIASNVGIDPFLAEFGRLYESLRSFYQMKNLRSYENLRQFDDRTSRVLCGTYHRQKGDDFIRTPDGRELPVANTSSGQQEALPLAITLAGIARTARGAVRSTLVVEEPEAHLYPTAQREMVHLFAAVTDLLTDRSTSQYLITTHSPYVLSALNNLMYGGKIIRDDPEKASRVTEVIGDSVAVDPSRVRAYLVANGTAVSIIDDETGLVEARALDRVSSELAIEFQRLMDIDFGDDTNIHTGFGE